MISVTKLLIIEFILMNIVNKQDFKVLRVILPYFVVLINLKRNNSQYKLFSALHEYPTIERYSI